MDFNRSWYLVWIACASLAVAGCSSAAAPPEVAKAATESAPAKKATTAKKPAKPAQSGGLLATTERKFSPPFPQRQDLFQPPKRVATTQQRGESSEELVELKGFVNVGEPRVVLSIDGVVAPLPVGAEKYGVQVISIDPPSVVLQRGRNRWTASLD
jgi:hypothetical protein